MRTRRWRRFGDPVRAAGAVLLVACAAPDRTIRPADDGMLDRRAAYARLASDHQLLLAGPDEPGERLVILGRLTHSPTGEPLADRTIEFYQADTSGSYGESVTGDESTARLRGALRTDEAGRFLVSTVLPGDYGSRGDNRHVHMSITSARPAFYDFFFSQYMSGGLRRWAAGSDQGVVLDLRSMRDTLLAIGELPVRLPEDDE